MLGITHFETFLVAGILLNITPGNDTIYILTRSMAQGRKAGIVSVLGIATGSLVHTTLAALGLSVVIAKSILLFNLIKYAGAAYILYIGIQMLRNQAKLNFETQTADTSTGLFTIYRDAVFTNVLNPKVALFFIAFLPQFIDPQYSNSFIPFLLLGLTFTITGTIWCLLLAEFAALIFGKLRHNQRFATYLNRVCGGVLIGLGIKVALTSRS
ncbi:MAG: LysE family translocator [Spirosomataceae bacterium]